MTHYDDDPPRRRRNNRDDDRDRGEEPRRRNSLMQRRLRVARGEDVDEPHGYDDADDESPTFSRRPYAPAYATGSGCAGAALYLTLGGITIVLLALLFGRQLFSSFSSGIADRVPEQVRQVIATPTPTIRDRGGTLLQIRSLNRLETQSFSIERVIDAKVERGNMLDLLMGERLLLIASGDVIAGVDLSKLRESDITLSADGNSIILRLPKSEIFSASLNSERTRVYDKQTAIGTRITGGENPDLESQARQEGEAEILKAACEGGIMQKSAAEAKRSLEQFLKLVGFESVTVVADAGECVIAKLATP